MQGHHKPILHIKRDSKSIDLLAQTQTGVQTGVQTCGNPFTWALLFTGVYD